jgi:hypothetical protein
MVAKSFIIYQEYQRLQTEVFPLIDELFGEFDGIENINPVELPDEKSIKIEVLETLEAYLKKKNIMVHVITAENIGDECKELGYGYINNWETRSIWNQHVKVFITGDVLVKELKENAIQTVISSIKHLEEILKEVQKDEITFQAAYKGDLLDISYEGGVYFAKAIIKDGNLEIHLKDHVYPGDKEGLLAIKKMIENDRRLENLYEPPKRHYEDFMELTNAQFYGYKNAIHKKLLQKMTYKEIEKRAMIGLEKEEFKESVNICGVEAMNMLGVYVAIDHSREIVIINHDEDLENKIRTIINEQMEKSLKSGIKKLKG